MGFLDAIRVDNETAHTRLLAWLLNPREDHELGAGFLRRFWKAAIGDARVALNATTVLLEERQDETRADFTLSTRTRYVLVENKIHWLAFRRTQIEQHARSGQGRAKRSDRTFHLVVVLPDKRRHKDDIEALGREYALRTIEWSDIAAIARDTAASRSRPVPSGNAFLLAYADFIERKILHHWKGFNMSVLTPQVVSAAATYLVARRALLNDLRDFCAAVHEGLESAVSLAPRERREKHHGDWLLLLMTRYAFAGWRTHVELGFYTKAGAKSLRSVMLEVVFYCKDEAVLKRIRRRGLRTHTTAVKRFGPKAQTDFGDGVWVREEIPRNMWLTNNATRAEAGITYARRVLNRYLREAHRLVK